MDVLIYVALAALLIWAFFSASKCQARKHHDDEDFAAIPLSEPGQSFWQNWFYSGCTGGNEMNL